MKGKDTKKNTFTRTTSEQTMGKQLEIHKEVKPMKKTKCNEKDENINAIKTKSN